jgi:hypothetical protein
LIPFHHRPDFRQVDAEIVMNQHMAHFDDLGPGNLLMGLAKCGAELTGCFADNLDMVDHPGMNEFVFLEDERPRFAYRSTRLMASRISCRRPQSSLIKRSRLSELLSEAVGRVRVLRPHRPGV